MVNVGLSAIEHCVETGVGDLRVSGGVCVCVCVDVSQCLWI